jgi:hypothetical protein
MNIVMIVVFSTPAKYDAEFRKAEEEIRKWQIEEFGKVIGEETTEK